MLVLFTQTGVYEVDASTWALTSKLSGLTAGDVWDLADFGSYIIATNGNVMVKRSSGTWSNFASIAGVMPRVLTLCNFKGQCIGGNVKTTWHGCSTNSLVWSEIGALDFEPTKLNTAGFRNIPWPGDVYRVKRLGDIVAVYGSEGVGALLPVSEPVSTFGLKELLNVGIPAKGAIGGDEHVHAFVDEEGWLWLWEEGKAPQRIGYQEFFSAMTLANISTAFDPSEQEFYISDGSTSYLLTRYGLCETYQRVTSLVRHNKTSHGPSSSGSDTSFTAWTDTIDFGIRGFKTLTTVAVGVDTGEVDQDIKVSIKTRANKKDAFAQSSWFVTNPEGVVMVPHTAHEFQVGIKADSYAGVNVDYVNMRVKLVDRRFIRGVYAMQRYAEGQGG